MENSRQNEIDALLRAKSSREKAPVPANAFGTSGGVAEPHLDADELSAFAENALPAGARARCAGHLAECDICRHIVVGLAADRVIPAEAAPIPKIESSGFIARALSIFRMPAVGYGFAALVLMVLGLSILIPLLNRNRPDSMVAQKTESDSRSSIVQSSGQSNAGTPLPDSPAVVTRSASSPTSAAANTAAPPPPVSAAEGAGRGGVDLAKTENGIIASNSEPVLDEAEKQRQVSELKKVQSADQPTDGAINGRRADSATIAAAPPAPKPATEEPAQRKYDKDKAAEDAKRVDQFGYHAKEGNGDDISSSENRPSAGAVAGRKVAPAKTTRDRELSGEAANDSVSVTRSVGGKRFVNSNGEWFDEAFRNSMSPLNVKRGSDQYKSLIADEPQLRVYSEQLSGAVTVVWKGRAYRFH